MQLVNFGTDLLEHAPPFSPFAQVTFKWSSTIPNVDLSDASSSSIVFTPTDLVGNVEVGKVSQPTTYNQWVSW
jgi:hypothetical protein